MKNFSTVLLVLFFASICRFFLVAQSTDNYPPSNLLTDELPFHLDIFTPGEIFIAGRTSTFVSDECYISKHDKDGNFLWAKIIGGGSYDYFQKTIEYNNTVICGGNTNSFGQNFRDFYLVRFDQNGDTLWTKILGGSKFDQLMDIIQDSNTILSGGFSNSFGSAGNNDILLINSDSSGNPLWSKSLEAGGEDILHSIKKSPGGGFIIVGNTTSFGSGMKDVLL